MADLTLTILGVDALSGPARAAAGSLSGIESAAGRVGGALTSVAATAAKAALALGAISAGALAAGLGTAVTAAAGFEKQLSAISAVSSKVDLEMAGGMKALSAAALQLGKDTSFSASEAAAGMEELVKAGVGITDVLGGGARAALDLAAAGAVSVTEAATVASNAMNAFGLAGSDMAHIADTLAGASVASATDVHQLGFAIASVGAVAHTIGFSFDDTTTAISLFAQAGLKGSDAGTSLKTMLLNLSPSTKGAKAEMEALGLITADGGNQFFDATGKVKSMAEVAGILQNATKDLTQEQKINSLQTIFGTDAIRAAAILAEQGAEGIDKMSAAQKAAGGATAIANERLNNLAGSIEKFKGSAETAAITVGMKFTPTLKRLVDIATEGLNRAIPVMEKWAEVLAVGLDKMIERATNAGPAFLAFGATLLTLGRYFGVVATDGDAMNDWLTHLPAPLAAVAALVGTVGAAIRTGLIGAFETLKGLDISAGIASLAGAFSTLVPIATGLGQAIITNLVGTFQFLTGTVLPPLLSIFQQTADAVETTLWPAFQQTGVVMRGIFGETLNWLATTVWPPFLGIVKQTADFFTGVILPTLPGIATAMRTTLGETVQWLSVTVWPALTAAATVAWGYITGTIVPALPAFAAQVRTVLGGALEWVGKTGWPMLVAGATTAWTFITTKVIPAVTDLISWLKEKLPPAIAAVTAAWEAVRSRVAPIVEALFNGDIKTAISNAGAAFSEFGTLAMGWLGEQVALIDWDGIWATATTIGSALGTYVAGLVVDFGTWLGAQVALIPWASVWEKSSAIATDLSTYVAGLAVDFGTWLGAQAALIDWTSVWNKAVAVVEATAMWFADAGVKFAAFIGEQVALIDWVSVWNKAVAVVETTAMWFADAGVKFGTWLGEQAALIDWNAVWAKATQVVENTAQWFVTTATLWATWLGDQVALIDWNTVWLKVVGMAEAMQAAFMVEAAKIDWKVVLEANTNAPKQMTDYFNTVIPTVDWASIGKTLGTAWASMVVTVFDTLTSEKSLAVAVGSWAADAVVTADWATVSKAMTPGWMTVITTLDWAAIGTALADLLFNMIQAAWNTAMGRFTPTLPSWLGGGATPGAAPAQRPPGTTPQEGMPQAYTGEWEQAAYAAAVKANHPDPTQFVEQMRQESGLNPNTPSSHAGAQGIAQIMPGVAAAAGVNPNDPNASLEYAANRMTQAYQTYGGDSERALASYNMGAGNLQTYGPRGLAETNDYINRIDAATNERRQGPVTGPYGGITAGGSVQMRHKVTGNVITASQEDLLSMTNRDEFDVIGSIPQTTQMSASTGWDPAGIQAFRTTQQDWSRNAADANAICGPYLASLFADAVGRPPTPEEARALGAKMNIYQGNGITSAAGFDEYATALIQQINPGSGVGVQQQMGVTNAQGSQIAAASLAGGAPIAGFNTKDHYFGATQFDPSTGAFNVGGTGLSLSGGKEWMTVDEMTAKMGPLLGVLTLTGETAAAAGASLPPVADGFLGMGEGAAASQEGIATAETALVSLTENGIGELATLQTDGTVAVQTLGTDAATALGTLATDGALAIGALQADGTLALGTLGTDGTLALSTLGTDGSLALTTLQTDGSTSLTTLGTDGSLALTTLGTDGGASLTTLGSDGALALGTLETDGALALETLNADGTTSLGTLHTDGVTELGALSTEGVTAAGTLHTDAGAALDLLNTEGVAALGTLNTDGVAELDTLNTDGVGAAGTLRTDGLAELDALSTEGVVALNTLNTDGVAEMDTMNTESVAAAEAMHADAAAAVADLASEAGESFGTIVEDAGAAATGMEAVGQVEIPAPDVSDVIDAMDEIRKAAQKAAAAVEAAGDAGDAGDSGDSGDGDSGDDDDDRERRAAGGPVAGGRGYIVGENGPEFFMPYTDGEIIPNHRIKGWRALGGPVSASNPFSPIGTTPDGISGDFGQWIVEDITRATNESNALISAQIEQMHTDLVDLTLGTAVNFETLAETIDVSTAALLLGVEAVELAVAAGTTRASEIGTTQTKAIEAGTYGIKQQVLDSGNKLGSWVSDSGKYVGQIAAAGNGVLVKINTAVDKIAPLLTLINTGIGKLATGTAPRPPTTPTPAPPAPAPTPPDGSGSPPGSPGGGNDAPTPTPGPGNGGIPGGGGGGNDGPMPPPIIIGPAPDPPRRTPEPVPPGLPRIPNPAPGETPTPRVPAPTTPRGIAADPFEAVTASAAAMVQAVAGSTAQMKTVSTANVTQMARGVTSVSQDMGDDVGSIFLGITDDSFGDFIKMAQAVDDAIYDMATNVTRYIDTMGVTASGDFGDLNTDGLAAMQGLKTDGTLAFQGLKTDSTDLMNLFAKDVITIFGNISEADGGVRDSIIHIGDVIEYEMGVIRAAPTKGALGASLALGNDLAHNVGWGPAEQVRGAMKNMGQIVEYEIGVIRSKPTAGPLGEAVGLGEDIAKAFGKAISDSQTTKIVKPLVDAVVKAVGEAKKEGEKEAARSARASAVLDLDESGGRFGGSDGPGMAELIAEVKALKATIASARSIEVSYGSSPPASLTHDVSVLEALSRSGT